MQWSSSGLLVVYQWSSSGLLVVYQWSSSGLLVVYQWSSSGLLVVYQWSSSATDCHILPLTGLNASVTYILYIIYRLKCSKAISGMDVIGLGWKSLNAPLL